MNEKQNRQYQKLLEILRDPDKKGDFHNDPDIGHILSKLSLSDVRELRQIAMATPNCEDPDNCQKHLGHLA
jgi:hypothetical protein